MEQVAHWGDIPGKMGCEKPGVVEGSLQDTWTRWPLKVPSSKTILWVWDSRTVVAHSKSPYHWGHVTCGTWGWEMADYCRDGDTLLVLHVGMKPCPYHRARLISKVQTSGEHVLYVFCWMMDFSQCEWTQQKELSQWFGFWLLLLVPASK